MTREDGTAGVETPTTFSRDTLHSVLNQLALVVSYSELVLDTLPSDDERADDLRRIQDFARNAARLLGRPLEES